MNDYFRKSVITTVITADTKCRMLLRVVVTIATIYKFATIFELGTAQATPFGAYTGVTSGAPALLQLQRAKEESTVEHYPGNKNSQVHPLVEAPHIV